MKNFHEFFKIKQELLNEISPELLDRAARKAYSVGDDDGHRLFKGASERRKYPDWDSQFKLFRADLLESMERLKRLIYIKGATPDQIEKTKKIYDKLVEFYKDVESIN